MLEKGTKAPEFSLPDENGEIRSLADYKGKNSYYISIRRIIHPDVQSRLADSQSFILSLMKKV